MDEKCFLSKFIECYEKNKALWDVTSSEYKIREKKNYGYRELLKIFKNIKQDATIDDVKKKINSLRSNYRRELRKLKQKQSEAGTDDIYQSSVWWFDKMNFLEYLGKPLESIYSLDLTQEFQEEETVNKIFFNQTN